MEVIKQERLIERCDLSLFSVARLFNSVQEKAREKAREKVRERRAVGFCVFSVLVL